MKNPAMTQTDALKYWLCAGVQLSTEGWKAKRFVVLDQAVGKRKWKKILNQLSQPTSWWANRVGHVEEIMQNEQIDHFCLLIHGWKIPIFALRSP